MSDKIFSISEAAEYLGVFPLTLRNWEKKDKIKSFRTLGGHRRFRKSDLDVILAGDSGANDKLKDIIKGLESINPSTHDQAQFNTIVKELKEFSK